MSDRLVELDAVVVAHPTAGTEVRALDGVDFALDDGESVALWGPSGSGKTTLLHVLGGLVTPTSGEVIWRGRPLSSLDAAARSRARSADASLLCCAVFSASFARNFSSSSAVICFFVASLAEATA